MFVDRDSRARSATTAAPRWLARPATASSARARSPRRSRRTSSSPTAATPAARAATPARRPTGAAGEWGLDEWKRAIDALADAGVFHLALGGGESAVLPWLGELAAHARARGLVPNLTTSGLARPRRARRDRAAVRPDQRLDRRRRRRPTRAVRGFDGFARADARGRALRARQERDRHQLRGHARTTSTSSATSSPTPRRRRLTEVELLRFKPSGRGARAYEELRCTDEQHRAFLPTILAPGAPAPRARRVDCSYTPMIALARPGRRAARASSPSTAAPAAISSSAPRRRASDRVQLRRAARGQAAASPSIARLLGARRTRSARSATGATPSEPCRTCAYHALCRGGCRVVTAHACRRAARARPRVPARGRARAPSGCGICP